MTLNGLKHILATFFLCVTFVTLFVLKTSLSKGMFNRCKLQRLVIKESNEKDKDSIDSNEKDWVEDEIQGRDESNNDNPPMLRTDSSTTTSSFYFWG